MPEYDRDEPIRVKDKDTGHVYTIRASALPHGNYQELKQDAVDPNTGDFLPPEFNDNKGSASSSPATSKES